MADWVNERLNRSLHGFAERQIDLVCFPLYSREDDITRVPGHRVRRFCLHRATLTRAWASLITGPPWGISPRSPVS